MTHKKLYFEEKKLNLILSLVNGSIYCYTKCVVFKRRRYEDTSKCIHNKPSSLN